MQYLFSILKRKNGGNKIQPKAAGESDGYMLLSIELDNVQLASGLGESPSSLFSPFTPDVDFLICCQIVRDMGEYTGLRGCGMAVRSVSGTRITLGIKIPQMRLPS